ncbi:hypothetical protein BR93DRAFT_884877 [Coniochaeta sp. PMI_546]|nr:hypothetical protein BR93DRAFT_884877 [Coniochaeta sp. PMI_546]
MHRQDSGYESLTPASSQTYSRRRSSTSVVSSGSRPQTRSSVRRASRSGPVVYVSRDSIQPVGTTTCCQRYRKWEKGTYHFPHLVSAHHVQAPCATDGDNSLAAGASPHASDSKYEAGLESTGASTYPSPPPQTTHYWTSDRTRRLEYAAIDAASRGVRGWVMRHMVPDCFIPEDCRPVRFDDDRGSVVRYRLELDGDDKAEKERPRSTTKRRSRWFGTTHS